MPPVLSLPRSRAVPASHSTHPNPQGIRRHPARVDHPGIPAMAKHEPQRPIAFETDTRLGDSCLLLREDDRTGRNRAVLGDRDADLETPFASIKIQTVPWEGLAVCRS